MNCVPGIPKLPEGNPSDTVLKTYYKKLWIRREYCDRFGLKRFNQIPNLRYCGSHEFENVTAHIKLLEECLESGFSVKINIPKPIGITSCIFPAKASSKGNATDRAKTIVMKSLDKSSNALELQYMVELTYLSCGKSKWYDYNRVILEANGLDVHMKCENDNDNKGDNTDLDNGKKRKRWEKEPEITFKDCLPIEVRCRIGFCDLKRLLIYVAILCNGSVELMVTPSTSMTCIEEWIFFFEFTYGRTTTRWMDYTKNWNLNEKALQSLLKRKIEQELQTRQNWLMYTTVDEDIKLRTTET